MEIWKVLKKSTAGTYRKLFKFVILNIIWFLLSLLVIFVGYFGLSTQIYILLAIPIIFLGPFFMAGLETGIDFINLNDFRVKKYFVYIIKNFKRAFLGFLLSFFIYSLLILDLVFFLKKGTDSLFMLILAVLILYILIFFSMMQCYYWGFLVLDKEKKIRYILKNSLILTIDNVIFSLLWLIIVLIITLILILTGFGMVILLMNFLVLMILYGTIQIASNYDKLKIEELNSDE